MKLVYLLALLSLQSVSAGPKIAYYYVKGPLAVKNCDFGGYVPAGGAKEVSKIKAPVAAVAKSGIAAVLGKASQGAGLAMHSLNLATKTIDAFSKVSPALGPALGVFGAVTGIFKSMTEIKPADILRAVNTAIADLTADMNEKLDEMKDYADAGVISSEKEMIERVYRKNFNLLSHCLSEPTKALSNECQRDSYKAIGSATPQFAIFDTQLLAVNPTPLTTTQVKKLEAYLVPFRNYANLVLMSLVPLVEVYSKDKSVEGRGYYKKFSNALKRKSEHFVNYAKKAVEAIVKMHDNSRTCAGSLKYGKIKQHYTGVHRFRILLWQYTDFSCTLDNIARKKCEMTGQIATKNVKKDGFTKVAAYVSSEENVLKAWGKTRILGKYAKAYSNKQKAIIQAYWQKEVLDFIPEWEKAAQIAEPGTKVKDAPAVPDEFSSRYVYRKAYAEMYP